MVVEQITQGKTTKIRTLVIPPNSARLCAAEVPEALRKDYLEAAAILSLSPNASAALSRRCLQIVLVSHLGAKGKDLANQIDDVLKRGVLPAYVSKDIDHLRNLGNFGAHAQRDVAGEIIDVEPNEAEWTLTVLDSLFDDVFVKPAFHDAQRAKMNAKYDAAGKAPAKEPAT